eukprot:1479686-Prymnesium_polylepis.1
MADGALDEDSFELTDFEGDVHSRKKQSKVETKVTRGDKRPPSPRGKPRETRVTSVSQQPL